MKKSTHKRLTAWLLTLALVVTLLPGMGMTALAVEDESTGPPAVTAPTDPVDPIDPVDPVDPFDPVDPVDPTDSVDPVDPIDPVDPEPPKPPEEPEPSGEPLAPPVMKAPMRAASLTAAANGIPGATSVFVDDGKSFYDGAGNQNQLYYKNGDEADKFKGTVDDYNAHYDPDTGVLTLKGYAGGRISVGGTAKADIIIELVGENIVNGSVSCDMGGDITIKGSGSLKVTNAENGNGDVCGIAAGYGNLPTGNVTIAGSANVTINAANHYNGSRLAYGIFARQSITISDSASVDITCSAPNSTASRSSCYGMYVSPSTSGGRVTIDTAGDIQIKATDAGSEAYSYGLCAPSYTLTKVRSMEVQWKDASNGGAIYGAGAFDTTTHAVNENKSRCYASYRYGEPHKVTVAGGYITADSPGINENVTGGNFLEGDPVTLVARELKDNKNAIPIPFDKWISNDVTITSGSSQTVSFKMPSKDVAVRANYDPFTTDGQPKFTRTSSTEGKISLTLVSGNFDSMGTPKIYRASDLEKINSSSNTVSGNQRTFTVYSDSTYDCCPPGEYVVGVSYNGVMCYSEPFRVKYTTPSASVDDVTVSGSAGTAISETSVTVTLENDTFASALSGDWIQNLPAGLSQSVMRTDERTATITITGTPQVGSTEVMQITIPAGALVDESGMPVKVSIDGKAKFDIKSNAPTAENIQIGDGSNNKFSTDKLYYKNGENGAKGTFSNDSSNWNAYYNPATGTLTLKDYNGPYIGINGGDGQTVTVKLEGNNNTVHCNFDPPIQLNDGVNLIITSEDAATLTLDAGSSYGIGSPRSGTARNIGFVQIAGKVTVNVEVSANEDSTYGIFVGDDISVLEESSLKITCTSNKSGASCGIMTSGKVTVDTTGTVDVDVSKCGNGGQCISANKIAFKNAEAITLKYIPSISGWGIASSPTTPSASLTDKFDASGMKSPKTTTDGETGATTVTYAKKGARPAKPTISAYSFTFDQLQEVALTCATPGTVIYYTTDGSDPTTSSTRTQYSESFYVRQSCTLKAVAYSAEDEQYSAVAEAVFTRRPVSITVVGGGKAYSDSARTIEITQAEPGTTVYLKAPAEIEDGTKVFSEWSAVVSITNKESCNNASFTMYKTAITITANYKPKPDGVTVSGTAVSWNDSDDAEYYLYPADTEDTTIRAQWKKDGTVSGYCSEYTVEKGSITQNADGKRYDQTFSFSTVPAGTYKLVIFKPEKYVPKIVTITVGSTALDLGQLKLWLYGDVNYDGQVLANDATQIIRKGNGVGSIFDTGDALTKIDRVTAADLNEDGVIKTNDAAQITRFANGLGSTFNNFK